jgi:hypothetical protein
MLAASATLAKDAPEISRSVGVPGGVLLFWPRIIPRSETVSSRPYATMIQKRLAALVGETLAKKPMDIRPEPERVCPRSGCRCMTVGALLLRSKSNCVVLGLFSRPGKAATTLVPWVGDVELKTNVVGFREPPESQVTIIDWTACADVEAELDNAKEKLTAAIHTAAGL